MKLLLALIKTSFYTILLVAMPLVTAGLITANTTLIPSYRSIIVTDHTMEPLTLQGSLALVKTLPSYAVNDIITFHQDGKLITSRIISLQPTLNGTVYKTLGESDALRDAQTVTEDQIIGKGLFQIMYAGTILSYLMTIKGMVLGIALPSLTFIALLLYSIHRSLLKKSEKKLMTSLRANGLWQPNLPSTTPSLHQLIRENSYMA